MRPFPRFLLVLAAAEAALPAAAGEEGDLREDLGLLVAASQQGVREEHDGPSPTTLARRILGRKEKEVRALLEEAWKRSDGVEHPATDFSDGVRHVAEYLYGLEKTGAAPVPKGGISFGGELGFLREEAGLVLLRPGGSGQRGRVMGEKGWDRDGPEPRPTLASLLKGGKWRKAPRPDAKAALALLAKDAGKDWSDSERESFLLGLGEACGAAAGNLSFAGREPGPFEVSGGGGGKDRDRGRGEDRAWSGVRCPIPDWMEATEASPWRLSSPPVEGGLRLTLSWRGPGKAALDPVAFRYVCAEYLPVRIGGGGGARSFTYLKLQCGPLGGWASWRVPADRLRVLAPGESSTFDVAVAPEHAKAEHVSLELNDTFGVAGPCPVPPTRILGWSWVR